VGRCFPQGAKGAGAPEVARRPKTGVRCRQCIPQRRTVRRCRLRRSDASLGTKTGQKSPRPQTLQTPAKPRKANLRQPSRTDSPSRLTPPPARYLVRHGDTFVRPWVTANVADGASFPARAPGMEVEAWRKPILTIRDPTFTVSKSFHGAGTSPLGVRSRIASQESDALFSQLARCAVQAGSVAPDGSACGHACEAASLAKARSLRGNAPVKAWRSLPPVHKVTFPRRDVPSARAASIEGSSS